LSSTEIVKVKGRSVWDSRGRPTVEAEVALACGAHGRAIAPAGASTGSGEAVDLRDREPRFGGMSVDRAVAGVNGEIAAALRGRDAAAQPEIDRILISLDGTPNKSRLGGNALIAVSMAALHAAAVAAHLPLYAFLLGERPALMPLPQVQIFGGGAHAGRRVDVQDFMIVAPRAGSFREALEQTAEVYRAAGVMLAEAGRLYGVADEGGYWPAFDSNEMALTMLVRAIERAGFTPGEDIAISLDIAASQLYRDGTYHVALEDRVLSSEDMTAMLIDWIQRYPIVSLEDPLAEWDEAGLVRFTKAVGNKLQIVGDDYLVTNESRIAEAARAGACNAVLIKPNQAATVTETIAAREAARATGYGAIASARSGESEDTTIVHLAVGLGIPQLKVGSFARSERMAKWNEGLRIEETLGAPAFAGQEFLRLFPRK
jgi:enolase 1/2/3